MWARRIFQRARAGKNVVARWRLSAAEFDRFREEDAARSAGGGVLENDWVPPRAAPPDGLEVIVLPDGVMLGGVYFGLATTGISRFDDVQGLASPASLEFRILFTQVRGGTVAHAVTNATRLRVPVSPGAAAQADVALGHFERVLRREIIVNPGFWTLRIRIGLWTAAICAAVAAGGYAWAKATANNSDVVVGVIVGSAVFAIGGLVLALAAWAMHRAQRGH